MFSRKNGDEMPVAAAELTLGYQAHEAPAPSDKIGPFAVPEYLGVWEWGDLEIEECCPFCGCLCGMHFQDASQMYYCLNCDTLTDFSEVDPRNEDRDD